MKFKHGVINMGVINMEVRIKDNNGYVDADWTIEDGVMVVSPKEVMFEPKDGDVFCVDSLYPCVGIVTEEYSYGKPDKDRLYFSVGYWIQSGNMQLGTFCACNRNTEPNYRHATEEEKKKLFAKLKEEGYEFDFEKKELIKLKWKPKVGDEYYHPSCSITNDGIRFDLAFATNTAVSFDMKILKHNLAFKTKEECQEFCDKLNQAIEGVKP